MINKEQEKRKEQERLEAQAQAIVDLRKLINNCGIRVDNVNQNSNGIDSNMVFEMKKKLVKEVAHSVNENVRQGNYQAVCFNDLNSIKTLQEIENQRLQEEYLKNQAPKKERSLLANITILGLISQTIFDEGDKVNLSKNLDVLDAFKAIKSVTSLNELNAKIMKMIEGSLLSQGSEFTPFVKDIKEKSILNPGEDMGNKLNGIQKMINEIIEKQQKEVLFSDQVKKDREKEAKEIGNDDNSRGIN